MRLERRSRSLRNVESGTVLEADVGYRRAAAGASDQIDTAK
jgi:hypothetical protein